MSEARHQRFEIDIDEIERELRRSASAAPAPRTDPLAELARIVGQDDPFRGIIGEGRAAGAAGAAPNVHAFPRGASAPEPVIEADDRLAARDTSPQSGAAYDPVADVYGSSDAAMAEDDIRPLRSRRSRGKLAAVAATLVVATGAVAGGLYWHRSGGLGGFGTGGAPPLITADRTPVKKPPENPGGMEVPNQDRAIYERAGSGEAKSRVVDGREQPIDVREAARNMPSTADRAPSVSARAPVAGPAVPPDGAERPADPPVAAARPQNGSSAVASALGEPRRVRTVAVRPDGSTYTPATTSSIAEAPPSLLPGGGLPPPVPVTTVAVPSRPGSPPAAAPAPPADPAPVAETQPAQPAVKVLPPARPRGLSEGPAAEAPTRTAAVQPDAPAPRAAERERRPAAAEGTGGFAVQIAVRPTEAEARSAYGQLQDKYGADLDGKPARVTRGEVNGKTVHRVRVGPMSKADANALCTKLKASGGSCFVANVN